MSNIYLIGMRGVGKSTIGKLLAERLNRKWVDVDDEIVKREEKSIAEMVALHGWDFFREKEHEEVERLAGENDLVISTGGGVLMHYNNAELLKASGKLILLIADPATLVQRLKDSHQRPSLTGKDVLEEIYELWEERKDEYYKAADLVVDTEPWDEKSIIDKIEYYIKMLPSLNNDHGIS